ncbi:MAG: hypothetical protein JNJ59_10255 [Deltaproteobacteria bacterium]|nr:hypothetical protein [Deltaproteobacteria bacterium]
MNGAPPDTEPSSLALLALSGLLLLALSGLPPLIARTRRAPRAPDAPPARGPLLGTLTLAAGAALLLTATTLALVTGDPASLSFAWALPFGRFAVAIDPVSALFLYPIALMPVLAVIYGHGYWDAHADSADRAKVRLFIGLLAASLALLVMARDAILFLIAWEGMALASFFLITTDDRDPAARAAGWTYLVATHVGTLALFALFAILAAESGDTALSAATLAHLTPSTTTALYTLGLLGFGLKAGLMPLHVWLPPAHAAAPSHVSALLSGVVTKAGIYGLLRLLLVLPPPPAAIGQALLLLGAVSAILGLVLALGQRDLKRVLAYSTVENIGVMALGLGLALAGKAHGAPDLVALGFGGMAFHILAHALTKTALFFGAGAVHHALGHRDLDRMGGLQRHLPRTARLVLVATLSAAALPPLAAFASELLIYLGAFRAVAGSGALASLAAPVLALTGALALATFVRTFAFTFLGTPREPHAAPHDPPRTMLAPMAFLAALILVLGLFPQLVVPLLDAVTAELAQALGVAPLPLATLVPFDLMSILSASLLLLVSLAVLLLWRRLARAPTVVTWDCGYAAPTARMQYSATSFGASLVDLFAGLVRPRVRKPRSEGLVTRLVPDPVLAFVLRTSGRLDAASARLRTLTRPRPGRLQLQILYILLAVIALFLALGLGLGGSA